MQNYIKYYWLESEYLEKEVFTYFEKNGYLTPEQFFSILFWKSKRPIKKWVRPHLSNEAVRSLTEEIHNKPIRSGGDEKEKLDILLSQPGFGISMASAVLTILYPNEFTVYDYRAQEQLNQDYFKKYRKEGKPLKNIPNVTDNNKDKVKKLYWEFVETVKRVADDKDLSLRNCDRLLWAKSWYEDLQKFLEDTDTVRECLCDNPDCAKCLAVNCKDINCKTHTQYRKDRWKQRIREASVDNSG